MSDTEQHGAVPPRKRTKVSRACDEIRCDAAPDKPTDSRCSSCRKTGETCTFSRVPMKRGPTKGHRRESTSSFNRTSQPVFIHPKSEKDLMSPTADELAPVFPPSPPVNVAGGQGADYPMRKRAFSQTQSGSRLPSIHALNFTRPVSPQQQQLQQAAPGAPPSVPPMDMYRPNMFFKVDRRASLPGYPPNMAMPSPAPKSEGYAPSVVGNSPPHNSFSPGHNMPHATATPPPSRSEEKYLDNYYQVVHPILPILPPKTIVEQWLAQAEPTVGAKLRECLLLALKNIYVSSGGAQTGSESVARQLCELQIALASSDLSAAKQAISANSCSPVATTHILHLMIQLLVFVQTQDYSRLATAVAQGYALGIHTIYTTGKRPEFEAALAIMTHHNNEATSTHNNVDNESIWDTCYRLHMLVFVLDRLHSLRMSTPALMDPQLVLVTLCDGLPKVLLKLQGLNFLVALALSVATPETQSFSLQRHEWFKKSLLQPGNPSLTQHTFDRLVQSVRGQAVSWAKAMSLYAEAIRQYQQQQGWEKILSTISSLVDTVDTSLMAAVPLISEYFVHEVISLISGLVSAFGSEIDYEAVHMAGEVVERRFPQQINHWKSAVAPKLPKNDVADAVVMAAVNSAHSSAPPSATTASTASSTSSLSSPPPMSIRTLPPAGSLGHQQGFLQKPFDKSLLEGLASSVKLEYQVTMLSFIVLFLLAAQTLAQTAPITQSTYNFVLEYGWLSNVAYCVRAPGPFALQNDFTCGKSCAHFPNVSLDYQFGGNFFSTSVTGFLAHDHVKKEKYIVFRGTFSIADAITDIQTDQNPYMTSVPPLNTTNINSTSPSATINCPGCQVHDGFQKAYRETMVNIQDELVSFLGNNTDYKLIVTGHSLGAVTALFMAINLKNLGYDPTLINYGQPRLGNKAWADYVDSLFFKPGEDGLAITPERRMYRVTHWNDFFVGWPAGYSHTLGEVYIGDHTGINAPLDTVYSCAGPENNQCHHGFFNILERLNILKNHCAYLNWLFYCAINVDKREMMIDPPRFAGADVTERMMYEASYPM
ncbi:putative lipase [Yarrowia sp. B02]|nr:putative lipase [Yarrowia sp. B02]